MSHTTILFILFNVLSIFSCYYGDSIRMTDISALTFNAGEKTTARRSQPISQLECVSGSARSDYALHPTSVQCVNVGHDGKNVQWKCEANLDSKVKFGKLVVSCEGYNSRDDPNVLVGSCGLQYGLDYENPSGSSHYHSPHASNYHAHDTYEYDSSVASKFINIISFFFIIAAVYFVLTYFTSHGRNNYGNQYPADHSQGYANPVNGGGMGYNPGYGGGMGYNTGYGGSWWRPSYFSGGSGGGWWSGFATGGLLSGLWNRNSGYGSNYGYGGYGGHQRGGFGGFGGSSYGGSSYGSRSSSSSGSRSTSGYATSSTR